MSIILFFAIINIENDNVNKAINDLDDNCKNVVLFRIKAELAKLEEFEEENNE